MNCEASILLLSAFVLSFALAISLYTIGGRISPRSREERRRAGKNNTYACGEEPPPIKETRINCERFFIFAVFFMIFDVFAFMVAISYSAPAYLSVLYSLIAMMAVTLLIVRKA